MTISPLDSDMCYRALETRDARFDGRFFTGVTSTGIYCRPICPARTPLRRHCRFFLIAAAAQQAGFRACLRCRPEIAPQSPAWRGTASTVSRAMALISEGVLDGPDASVDRLAATLGVGGRQLRRLFDCHVGASPLAVAQTRRVLFAKQLLHDTRLPMASIALAAGFGSVRRFNHTFRSLYHRPPSQLRRRSVMASSAAQVVLRLPYRPPFDWESCLRFLAPRAVPGIEEVHENTHRRALLLDGRGVVIRVAHEPARNALRVEVDCADVSVLPIIAVRLHRVFDLDADTEAVAEHLASDPALAPLVRRHPGMRVMASWDAFECAVRAVLGQQVTVAAARTLAGKLATLCLPDCGFSDPVLRCAFPTPLQILSADLTGLGMPAQRRGTLLALARTTLEQPTILEPTATLEESITRLRTIPGIGEWSAQYIALRGLHHPDAFPASDVGILRGAAAVFGTRLSPAQLLLRSSRWRPWRGYAAQHLWAASAAVRSERSSSRSDAFAEVSPTAAPSPTLPAGSGA